MTTARDLITRSLISLGTLESGENPTSDEAEDALDTFNEMANAWIYDGIDLEWLNLTLNSTIPYPDDHIPAFRYNLAVELAPQYGLPVPPAVAVSASRYKKGLRNNYADPDLMEIDEIFDIYYQPNGLYYR